MAIEQLALREGLPIGGASWGMRAESQITNPENWALVEPGRYAITTAEGELSYLLDVGLNGTARATVALQAPREHVLSPKESSVLNGLLGSILAADGLMVVPLLDRNSRPWRTIDERSPYFAIVDGPQPWPQGLQLLQILRWVPDRPVV